MDRETMRKAAGAQYGRSLEGIGINLLVDDVSRMARFLEEILGLEIVRADADFAIIAHGERHFMLHADHTYHDNPLPSLLPEAGARGAGIEIRFYGVDPDVAQARARAAGDQSFCAVLHETSDRPHGLRECHILGPEGYCFVPSVRLPG
jgi:catechol 2,3-dioxygenase-like lactoylglutathione lyase family enzyme